jgi:hypothetical protein
MEKLWVDEYRPHTLKNLDYHKELSILLHKLAQ